MDSYEATRMVFSRIQSLEPENASKIMGYLLIQDHGEKEMIRLAFGPETLIHNLIIKAKSHLGIIPSSASAASTPSTPSSPSPFNPISRTNPLSISSVSRLSNNGSFDISNPASPSSTAWPLSGLSSPHSPSSGFNPISTQASSSSLSYASIVNNGTANAAASESLSSCGSLSSSAFPFYANNTNNGNWNNNTNYNGNAVDDYHRLQDHLSFLNDSKADDLFDPRLDLAMSPTGSGYSDSHLVHRRSFSVPRMCFGSDDANSEFGWKQCLYFAKGFCKNGSSCKFLHGDSAADASTAINVGSQSKLNEFEQCQGLLASKAAAHQRKLAAASQFMGAAVSFPYNKCMNLFLQQQNDTRRSAAAAALMMGEELHKFGRCRSERNDFSAMVLGGSVNPGSRQIYLTFPADSTFREEDVSNYFSIYGPVQDVRIPYQQKRMFGFVTFVYPETVKLILAKGNPHFVCDSRVLVKPYKEKGKVPDKKQQHQPQQMERGEHSACSSPSGLDSREPFDFHLGARMFYNTQEMLLRMKLEEHSDLQQAIELQGRRLMNLRLLDFKNNNTNHHHEFRHGLPNGSPIPSPTLSRTPNNPDLIFPPDGTDEEVPEENCGSPVEDFQNAAAPDADQQQEVNPTCDHNNGNTNNGSKEKKSKTEESNLDESLEHILPDNLFASPKKSAGDQLTVFSTTSAEADEKVTISTNNTTILPSTSTLNMASLKSCFLQMPRFSSGHGTIGM